MDKETQLDPMGRRIELRPLAWPLQGRESLPSASPAPIISATPAEQEQQHDDQND